MPHKHRQPKALQDPSQFNPPPSQIARHDTIYRPKSDPQPKQTAQQSTRITRKKDARKTAKSSNHVYNDNDTPRAFSRLVNNAYRPPRASEDDGMRKPQKSKTRKLSDQATDVSSAQVRSTSSTAQNASSNPPAPKMTIESSEPLSHFAARVDAALPFKSMPRTQTSATIAELKKGGPTIDASTKKLLQNSRKTKMEKRMRRMQAAWREEDVKIKARRFEEIDDKDDDGVDEAGVEEMGVIDDAITKHGLGPISKKKKKGHGKSSKYKGEDDIWKELETKRRDVEENRQRPGLVGLHDVVQAPPKFTRKAVKRVDDVLVGKAPGLKRQAELSEARKSLVHDYREMMETRTKRDERGPLVSV